MSKSFLKIVFVFLMISVAVPGCTKAPGQKLSYDKRNAVKDTGKKDFNGVSALETVKAMNTGWNLGNTLDATGSDTLNSETSWGMPKTTRAMIDSLAESGIKTVRIPVSWSNHIDKTTYTIDTAWMQRVKEIVDWAIDDDMYVIINSHHDCYEAPSKMPRGGGYYPNSQNLDESKSYLSNVWAQISLAFNNGYDEHLIFETMNEPRLRGTANEWWNDYSSPVYKDAANALNELNQTALDTIRASGGNNQKRYVMIPGLRAAADSIKAAEFKLPEDVAPDQLIISVHMYDPYTFALEAGGTREFDTQLRNELAMSLKSLNDRWVAKGIPVVIGEYGATNKNNLDQRLIWFNIFLKYSRRYGMTACLWDNGQSQGSETETERFGFFDRRRQKWFFPEILDMIMETLENQQ